MKKISIKIVTSMLMILVLASGIVMGETNDTSTVGNTTNGTNMTVANVTAGETTPAETDVANVPVDTPKETDVVSTPEKTVAISKQEAVPKTPGFESIFAIATVFLVAFGIRRR